MLVEYISFDDLVQVCVGLKTPLRRYKGVCYFIGSMDVTLLLVIATDTPDKKFKYIQWFEREGNYKLLDKWDVNSESCLLLIYDVFTIQPEEIRDALDKVKKE